MSKEELWVTVVFANLATTTVNTMQNVPPQGMWETARYIKAELTVQEADKWIRNYIVRKIGYVINMPTLNEQWYNGKSLTFQTNDGLTVYVDSLTATEVAVWQGTKPIIKIDMKAPLIKLVVEWQTYDA